MADLDSNPVLIPITKEQLFAIALAETAVQAAAEFMRFGGYSPSRDDFTKIGATIARSALAVAGPLLADTAASDDDLTEAAEQTGRNAVRAILGEPAAEALN